MSYALNALGVLTAIPANVAGGVQFLKLVKQHKVVGKLKAAQSTDEKLNVIKNVHPKVKIAFVHALLNNIVTAGAVWNWFSRSGNEMNSPTWVNILISALTAPVLALAVLLGGKMVFDHGVGVSFGRQGSSKEE